MLDAWIAANEANPDRWDQKNLGMVTAEMRNSKGLRVFTLPAEYTFVCDWMRRMYPTAKPVIEHFQASRRFRNKI